MRRELPISLRAKSDRETILEDIEPYLGTTPEERDVIMQALCRLAAEHIDAHPRRDEILAYQDPRSRESREAWYALVQRFRQK